MNKTPKYLVLQWSFQFLVVLHVACPGMSPLFLLNNTPESPPKENIWGLNYSEPNCITGDKSKHAFQAIFSTLQRTEIRFCLRNTVVSTHKASLCSTASPAENSRQTEDQVQRWKQGQGGFFSPPPAPFSLLSSPLPSPHPNLEVDKAPETDSSV